MVIWKYLVPQTFKLGRIRLQYSIFSSEQYLVINEGALTLNRYLSDKLVSQVKDGYHQIPDIVTLKQTLEKPILKLIEKSTKRN